MMMVDEDIDILVNDPYLFERTTKAQYYKHLNEKKSYYAPSVNNGGYKVGSQIIIREKKIKFDVRRVGDDYFYHKWQKSMLDNYIFKNNVKILNQSDQFYSLIYHEIIHKGFFRKKSFKKIIKLKPFLKFQGKKNSKDINILKEQLNDFIFRSAYKFVCPKEFSLGCNSNCLKNKYNFNFFKVSHFKEMILSIKQLKWHLLKDLSLRNIKNSSNLKIIFYFLYYFSRIMLYLKYFGIIRFKFMTVYTWLNLKSLFR